VIWQNCAVGYHTRPARALAMAREQALARALALGRTPDHLQGTTTV
jgi:hypothetical protein